MTQFPDWVPVEVISYYQHLRTGTYPAGVGHPGLPLHLDFEEPDIDALCRCIEALEMEKAWRAISKRKEKVDPAIFAFLILFSAVSCRESLASHSYTTKSQIAKYESLAKRLYALKRDLDNAFKHWPKDRLRRHFGGPPTMLIEDIAKKVLLARVFANTSRKSLKKMSGKLNSESGERTLFIRTLSEHVRHLYGQPLHKTVALTSGAILQEHIEEETVRKLVS